MKIAVYTIALNEEQFVQPWFDSAKDADYLLIADTGSTDGTVEKAKALGINVPTISIKPWRFDDARNASLALLPDDIDICIALDMDEVLLPGWREKLEASYFEGATRIRYKYIWSWNEDGSPGLEYGGDKIHLRHNYRWKHPVHEVVITDRMEEKQAWSDLEIHHHADNTKSRSSYLPLLELSVKEDPNDDRNAFYYARELTFYKQYEKAAKEFRWYLDLPTATWPAERSRAYRYLAECEPENAEQHLLRAIEQDPKRREAIVDLAMFYYRNNEWRKCYRVSVDAIQIREKPLDYLCEDFAWGYLPYDLAALSAYHLRLKPTAIKYGKKAVALSPNDSRLQSNLDFYLNKN
jgi:glycosyltransferase involved in cell wall biosynthesis